MPTSSVPKRAPGAHAQAARGGHSSTSQVGLDPRAEALRGHRPRPVLPTLLPALLGVLSSLPGVASARPCALTRIEAASTPRGEHMTLSTSCVPEFAVANTADQQQYVVRLVGATCEFPAGGMPLAMASVSDVSMAQDLGGNADGCLVTLTLRDGATATARREGQDLVLTLTAHPAGAAAATTAHEGAALFAVTDPTAYRDLKPALPAAREAAGFPPPGAVARPQTDVQAEPSKALGATLPRQALLGVDARADGLWLALDAAAPATSLTLSHPDRFVVDLANTDRACSAATILSRDIAGAPAWLKAVRLADWQGGTRVVFDLAEAVPLSLAAGEHGIAVAPRPTMPTSEATLAFGQAPAEATSSATALPDDEHTQAARGPAPRPAAYEQRPSADGSPGDLRALAASAPLAQQTIEGVKPAAPMHVGTSSSLSSLAFSLPFVGLDAPRSAPTPGERLRQKRISLDVKDADIINVLRLISEETGENIIASDEVHGRITMKLRNVSAEQALDTLLRVKGFDRVRTGDILRIASADTIQKERDQEVARKRASIEVEEVIIKMVTINYATASEVVDQLKPMLSGRGSVQVDARTNTLIMQDIGSNIDSLVELARRLDKQTPLVNIQARIVEADSTFVRDLGVQWGGAVKHTAVTGNPTGLYFPADITAQGTAELTAGSAAGAAAAAPSRYAVNLPAALTGSGAALGFILGSAGGSHILDLRLSAMETNGNGKVISSPEVSTLDNRTARVSQGVSFAVSTVSAAGTNVKFIPAVLQLEVTPHVTNDGTVLMKLHVQKSAPDFANRSGSGDPSINTKEAETEVLVKDGDTSVIGGILTRNTTESRNEVPFLSKIPLLGLLFREHSQRDVRSELLVFITPRIINRDESKLGFEAKP